MRHTRIIVTAISVFSLCSCFMQTRLLEVKITGGYVEGHEGNCVYFDVEYYQDGCLYTVPSVGQPHIYPTPAVISIGGYYVTPASVYEVGAEGVKLSARVSHTDGAELIAHLDTSAPLESSFTSPFFGIEYQYTFSPDQDAEVPIRNQYYVDAPTIDPDYSVALEFGSYQTQDIGVSDFIYWRYDIDEKLVEFIGDPIYVVVRNRADGTKRYLLTDGTMTSDPTPFDPSVTLQPAGILDLIGKGLP